MLRRGVLIARQGARTYATESKGPAAGGQQQPTQTQQPRPAQPAADAKKAGDMARAAEEVKRAEAAKLAQAQAQKEKQAAEQKAQAEKAAAAKAAADQKAAADKAAAEKATAEKAAAEKAAADKAATEKAAAAAPKAEAKAAETPATEAEPAAAPAVKTPESQNDELFHLLAKQHALLKRMTEDIEIAKGERQLHGAINGDVQIKDISRIVTSQVKGRVDGLKTGARSAVTQCQESLNKQSHLAIEAAAEQRKNLSKMNREQELPWQKDKPKAIYTHVGRWFLGQQNGVEAPVWMTALEVGVVVTVLLFWWNQRRKTRNKSATIQAIIDDMDSEMDAARDTIGAAKTYYSADVLKKEDELRDLQSFSAEQSVTLDSLSRLLYDKEN